MQRRILVLLSTAGGGDRQPVVALAVALAARGHEVTVLCDHKSVDLVSATALPTIVHRAEQVGHISYWARRLATDDHAPNPHLEWGHLALETTLDAVSDRSPDVLVSSLFCMGLADLLAERLGVPWCFVNPSFYFGDHSSTKWEDDWYGSMVPRLARDCFDPLVARAEMVLHATDPIFDFVPSALPSSHHYVGFLLWEPDGHRPRILDEPGLPLPDLARD